jgi:primosomal protein N' (replication factor Y)
MNTGLLHGDSLFPQAAAARRAQVLIPYPLARAYDYAIPDDMSISLGDYVVVTLGKKESLGVVWSLDSDDSLDPAKLKFIQKRHDCPPMPEVQRQFIEWVAKYTMSDAGMVLKMCLSNCGLDKSPVRAKAAPCQIREVPPNSLTFSEQQNSAADALIKIVAADKFQTVLLDGVTGSGKTEVYFEAIAKALQQDKQILVLLPEISLSVQFLERFERRFGLLPALWHSKITPTQKHRTWKGVAKGETRVVVGARSALFLPYQNLGCIIVDEEHDASYKQEGEGVLYHARDMAIVRAKLGEISLVLVSATPSLETMVNVKQNKYSYLHLPTRHAGAVMPQVAMIDLKKEPPERGHFLAPRLIAALTETLGAQEQSLLFLNRRGYAPLTLCRGCGYRFQCASCAAWLVEHRRSQRLQCHHCGHQQPIPKQCPECSAEDSLVSCGPGVERIQEEVQALFPEARTLILDSDLTVPSQKTSEILNEALRQIEAHEIDIIIGTQIIAKGHHFPSLTCVGIVDADLGLSGGDLRAGERTFQLLHQVSGRAGRGEKSGRVFIQTYMPEQPVMQALATHNRDQFLQAEGNAREKGGMPPYGRLAAVIVSSANELQLDQFCRMVAQQAPRFDDIRVLGPAPAPMAFLRGQYRRRFLVKTNKAVALQQFLRAWLGPIKTPSTLTLKIDIDPQNFY